MSTIKLISEVEAHAKKCGLSPATIISRAVSNGRLYGRLKNGHGCHLDTAEKIRAYMATHPPKKKEGAA
ncbi:hypothetical protein [Paracoccus sp. SM22M-07]|uniref:hypothetical protein n=1 Tax=Paracoccus sp. SM22M-07 TaxID=1520813 RepID=UPI000ACBFF99|nr:hypothetical protein [Paracoccus sp. SM22M-07]